MRNSRLPDWRLNLAGLTALGATALLIACGGGGGEPDANAAPPQASSYTQGPISGFGSVIVGGVHFDDSGATVLDEDGNSRSRSDLKLGMMVEVDSGAVDRTAATALALRLRWGSEIVGPVGSVDTTASTATVLGQTVLVTSSTIFDASLAGGLAALTPGALVEVHGILDPANARVVATRIEPRLVAPLYRLRGVIASLDTAARTFRINGELISYAGLAAASVPASLANNQVVRVLLQTAQVNGAWVATALRGGLRLPEPNREAHVQGVITVFTSSTSFEINGLPVDASNARFPDGTAGIVLGARVEVEGRVSNGVLVASKVEIEERRTLGLRPFELRGDVVNLDATAKTFALRGLTIWYGGNVAYEGGSEATLANGLRVRVVGVLASDRTRLEARRIEFR